MVVVVGVQVVFDEAHNLVDAINATHSASITGKWCLMPLISVY